MHEVLEDVVDHGLECHWAVSESKEHDEGFEEAVIGVKDCFPLITFLDSYIVVPLPYIQLSELYLALQSCVMSSGIMGRG